MKLMAAAIRALSASGHAGPVDEVLPPWEPRVPLLCAVFGLLLSCGLAVALRPASQSQQDKTREPSVKHTARLSPVRVWGITAMNLAYGFGMAAQGLVILPLEAERLWLENHSFGLGVLAALAGVAQLVGPQAGHWSDVYRSGIGRRRPLLLIATTLTCSMTLGLWYLSEQKLRTLYLGTWFCQQLAFNVLLSTQAGLVPDLVPAEQQDFAGGCSASNILVGAVGACVYVMALSDLDYHVSYGTIACLLAACCAVACISGDEESSLDQPSPHHEEGSWFLQAAQHYTYDFNRYWDFTLLLVTKTLYCSSVVVEGFLLFYVQDTFRSLPSDRYENMVSQMAATAEVAAALAAVIIMLWLGQQSSTGTQDPSSDTDASSAGEGSADPRRSKICISSGAAWMALLWWVPVVFGGLADQQHTSVGPETLVDTWLPPMLFGLGVWGLGQGVYLAGDQALAYALLPNQAEASRYLGFSSLCACVGSIAGGGICASLLSICGAGAPEGYAFPGYAAIFIFASALSAAISVVASFIKMPGGRGKGSSSSGSDGLSPFPEC
ncbi:unnamed protein product [Polarella glacialis]|uniref:Uncharacterized protein n=1 Tax=Polarella glacialis TaxID=89957 RepID=A0A813I2Q6_POLGL|nr:unnamed protein product [Polarella glacialis]CAE8687292.1 unnamed protein product [Polarella glacialis]